MARGPRPGRTPGAEPPAPRAGGSCPGRASVRAFHAQASTHGLAAHGDADEVIAARDRRRSPSEASNPPPPAGRRSPERLGDEGERAKPAAAPAPTALSGAPQQGRELP